MMTKKHPNVLFVLSDQHRWDFMGYESNGTTFTPHLDKLAEKGTVLRRAWCTAPLCSPSRAAIACGRYGVNSGCFTNLHQLPHGTPTFTQQFRKAGYRTCAIGKTHMRIHAYDSDLTSSSHRRYMDSLGWDDICETAGNNMFTTGIRDRYSQYLQKHGMLDKAVAYYRQWGYFMDQSPTDHPFVCHPWSLPEPMQEVHFLADRAIDFLKQHNVEQPFFLHLGFSGPHSPTEPHQHFLDRYDAIEEPMPCGHAPLKDWTLAARKGYRASITQIDHHIGRVLNCLDQVGQRDNTLIVYVSDHGEMAGDHGRFDKTCFFDAAMRVPLIVKGPGVSSGHESQGLVELLDLGKTLCDLCEIQPHELDQGQSFARLLRAQTDEHRQTIYSEMGCDRMLFDGRYKLMWGDPASDSRQLGRLHLDKPVTISPSPQRLYDMQQDPGECNNLLENQTPKNMALLNTLLGKLLTRINQNLQPQPLQSRGEYHPF